MFKVPEKIQPLMDAPRNIQIIAVIGVVLLVLSLSTLIVVSVRHAH